MPGDMFNPRPPRKHLGGPPNGWLFAVHLSCPRLDMLLSIAVSQTAAGATLEVEAIDPAWVLPKAAHDFALMEWIKANPAPLWVERATIVPESFESLLSAMLDLGATRLADEKVDGVLDGWGVEGVVAGPNGEHRSFSTLSPSATVRERHFAFVRVLLEAAKANTRQPATHQALAKWERFV